jgi:hypothetical protein
VEDRFDARTMHPYAELCYIIRNTGETDSFMKSKTLQLIPILILAVVPVACGDDHDENPNEEACEHFEMGPSIAVTAAAEFSTDAPKINDNHTRYDVTLVDVAGVKGGFVSFAASKAGDTIFFTNAPVQLTVTSSTMAEVGVKSSQAMVAECSAVKGRHVYPLQVGTYVIGIGGAMGDMVSFVVESAE